MNKTWLVIIIRRFGKGFMAGFVASLAFYLQQNPTIDIVNWKPYLVSAAFAALSGGLLAMEKLLQGYNPQ